MQASFKFTDLDPNHPDDEVKVEAEAVIAAAKLEMIDDLGENRILKKNCGTLRVISKLRS